MRDSASESERSPSRGTLVHVSIGSGFILGFGFRPGLALGFPNVPASTALAVFSVLGFFAAGVSCAPLPGKIPCEEYSSERKQYELESAKERTSLAGFSDSIAAADPLPSLRATVVRFL